MFTGLVRERGRVLKVAAVPEADGSSETGGVRLTLGHSRALIERLGWSPDASSSHLGASLAVSGVCLTLIDGGLLGEDDGASEAFSTVEMGQETLDRTTLGSLAVGDAVNLEPSLRLGDPMGGHWVQGHGDTTLEVLERQDREGHRVLTFELPAAYEALVVEKGSVTLDGVSLTVASLTPGRFSVWLIPHTLEITTLGSLTPGDRVNFEADILAKYVQRAQAVHGGLPGARPGG